MSERFPFEFDRRFRAPLKLLGVTPSTAEVLLHEDHFEARFGPWHCRTPWSNIRSVDVTRDYRWYRAIGPRASFKDRGATFGSSTRAGVCLRFHEPVAILFGSLAKHPGLTVTVAEPELLAAKVVTRIPTGD